MALRTHGETCVHYQLRRSGTRVPRDVKHMTPHWLRTGAVAVAYDMNKYQAAYSF